MKSQISAISVTLITLIPNTLAWGDLGHETIAYIATNFVTSATKTFFQDILGDTSGDYLADVATYADTYKYTAAGLYSKPYHFIDANDNPPSSCNVNYDRDCDSEGCVVAAIANYTQRVQDGRLTAANKAQAAKMIVHYEISCALPRLMGLKPEEAYEIVATPILFIGDIHQPLHDEALDVGGNTVDVTFNGDSTNLHAVWDTNIPEKYAGGYSLADAKSWAATLTTAIKSGTYKSEAAGWLTGMTITDSVSSAMVWASDSNAYVCSAVIPNGVAATEDTDLSGAYYTAVLPVVKLQFAKAGYRLAAWLNLIATGSTGL